MEMYLTRKRIDHCLQSYVYLFVKLDKTRRTQGRTAQQDPVGIRYQGFRLRVFQLSLALVERAAGSARGEQLSCLNSSSRKSWTDRTALLEEPWGCWIKNGTRTCWGLLQHSTNNFWNTTVGGVSIIFQERDQFSSFEKSCSKSSSSRKRGVQVFWKELFKMISSY